MRDSGLFYKFVTAVNTAAIWMPMSIGQSTSLVHTSMSQQLLDGLGEGITLLVMLRWPG